jgi:hypothetical protein
MKMVKVGHVAASCLVFLLAFAWWRGGFGAGGKGKAYTHLHCPECFLEMIYDAGKDGKTCPHCGATGPKMVATVGPWAGRESAGGGPFGNIVAIFIVMLAVGLVSAYAWILSAQARRKKQEEVALRPIICHCPFCERKIGYSRTKIGTTAVCPRCKTAFTLPEGDLIEKT